MATYELYRARKLHASVSGTSDLNDRFSHNAFADFLVPFEFWHECQQMLSVHFLYNFSFQECSNLAGRILIWLVFV